MSVQFKLLIGILFTVATIAALALYGISEDARMARYQASFAGRSVQAGADYFERYCTPCHGTRGEGVPAKGPALNRTDLLDLKNTPYLKAISWNGTTADFIRNTIAAGRPQFSKYYENEGFTQHMPTWSQDYGGPLRPDQINALVDFVLNWAPGENKPTISINTPTPGPTATPIPKDQILKAIPFPMPPSDATIAAGKDVYENVAKCTACHGPALQGNGPGAAGLPKQPRNFTDCAAMANFDLLTHYDAVVNGRTQNGMPAWGKKLTNEQIWQVIMYERTPCKLYNP